MSYAMLTICPAGVLFVRRDIKPENVVLTADLREVRLLDFGLSRPTDPVTRPLVRGRAGYVKTLTGSGE
jgi:serine/threonine protein kinase